jgi:hypothetical protein
MSDAADNFWTDDTSVLFTSFYGWTPETWGGLGWSNESGRSHRDKLLRSLTDPFIAVCYVTDSRSFHDPDARRKIAGFYLVSHEKGDRDEFTDAIHHGLEPEKWRHCLRALRAFTYFPETRLHAYQFDPSIPKRAMSVGNWGEVLTNRDQIERLRKTPWEEVPVYSPRNAHAEVVPEILDRGFVKAGPSATREYLVSPTVGLIGRKLYVLCLEGDMAAYLGQDPAGRFVYKIGLSHSPELRRQSLQKAMPEGAFRWAVVRTSHAKDGRTGFTFDAAVEGENSMKRFLHKNAKWLGGEFYLATPAQMDDAWRAGHEAAASFGGATTANG